MFSKRTCWIIVLCALALLVGIVLNNEFGQSSQNDKVDSSISFEYIISAEQISRKATDVFAFAYDEDVEYIEDVIPIEDMGALRQNAEGDYCVDTKVTNSRSALLLYCFCHHDAASTLDDCVTLDNSFVVDIRNVKGSKEVFFTSDDICNIEMLVLDENGNPATSFHVGDGLYLKLHATCSLTDHDFTGSKGLRLVCDNGDAITEVNPFDSDHQARVLEAKKVYSGTLSAVVDNVIIAQKEISLN